jgi:hypothetical protein
MKVQPAVADGGEPVARASDPGMAKPVLPGAPPDRKT